MENGSTKEVNDHAEEAPEKVRFKSFNRALRRFMHYLSWQMLMPLVEVAKLMKVPRRLSLMP
ncbi:hypothetical protein BP422_11815 [Brevibacillus formosus]|uniref:Uncharacterized protein n=1 Tax=Brevibacillus formosus TaxID=54913 RepID=A0A220MGK0_9BACL|nr:hypothetical protein BP422_11815 [Brevibacillus formosus]